MGVVGLTKLLRLSPQREEQDRVADQLIAWLKKEGDAVPAKSRLSVGALLMGISPTKFCVKRDRMIVVGGARTAIKAMYSMSDISQTLEKGSFHRLLFTWMSTMVYQQGTGSAIAGEEWVAASQLLGLNGETMEHVYSIYSIDKMR